MQIKGRSTSESLPEILDKALRRVRAGDSVEACLADYPQHARALEPLLRAGNLLRAEANTPLPPDLEAWLATGKRDFAITAAQLAPQYAARRQRIRARTLTAQRAAVAVLVVAIMMGA